MTLQNILKLRWFLRDILEFAKRNLLYVYRDTDQLSSLFLLPIVYTLLFCFLFGGAIDKTELAKVGANNYVNYIIAGAFVMNILFSSIITCVAIANDLAKSIIDRFRSLPINTGSLLGGYIAASLVRSIIITIMVALIGFIIGFKPIISPISWLGILFILILMTIAISSLMILIGIYFKNIETAHQVSSFVVLTLSMISSAIVPINTMPYWLKIIAENQPFTHAIESIRSLLFGITPLSNHIFLSIIWFIVISIVAFFLSIYLFSKLSK